MMLRVTIVLVALVGLSAANWELYKSVHGKSYSPKEDRIRRRIFEGRVARINSHNLLNDLGLTTYRRGLNQFTDLTNDEFRMYKGLRFNASNVIHKSDIFDGAAVRDLPATVDWRDKGYVTPVKDQGQCGSCWSFSTTGSLEGQNFKKTGKLISLSEQNLVDCSGSQGNQGCGGGWPDWAFEYVKQNGGIDTEASYPYTAQDGTCKYDANSIGAKCSGYTDIKAHSEDDLQKAVATVGPISVCIDAGHESFQTYKSGIYDEENCSTDLLDHAVLAVGYGTDNGVDYWLVKNSWNTIWGDQGYIKMSRNKQNQCGIATKASYPLV
jgi:cathepsin L